MWGHLTELFKDNILVIVALAIITIYVGDHLND